MTREQTAELLAIGGTVPGTNHVATTGGVGIWLDTPAQRVLRVLGLIEIVQDDRPVIFNRRRQFVRLTDAGRIKYVRLIAGAAEGVVERAESAFELGGFPWDCFATCNRPGCVLRGCEKKNSGERSASPEAPGQDRDNNKPLGDNDN